MARTTPSQTSAKDRVSDAASTAKDKVTDAASTAKDTVQEKAGELAGQAKSRTQEARERVGGRVRDEVDRRSTEAGEQVTAVAEALRKAADDLESDGKEAPARMARQAAERLQGVGGYLSVSDGQRILSDLESFARRQPWLVTAAGALVGIAAARFLKASRPSPSTTVNTPAPMSPGERGVRTEPVPPASPVVGVMPETTTDLPDTRPVG